MIDALCREIHLNFARRFGTRTMAVSREEIEALAAELGTVLPTAYAVFLEVHGALYCPSILQVMAHQGLDHPDLRQFLTPRQIMAKCRELWTQCLPAEVYVFASDCLGNSFCFQRAAAACEDAPVLFLSRQQEELLPLDETFNEMLQRFLRCAEEFPQDVPVRVRPANISL